ncbi:MAG: hypothetical protein FJ288_19495 [Planctomycetes bacterium]|nr:hypothetical protein [Planctomycetota bacterium]
MRPASRAAVAALAALSLSAACLLAWCAGADAAAPKTLLVEAGKTARANAPMCVPLPEAARAARMTDAGNEVPCQVADGKLWFILDGLAAGAAKTYAVQLGAEPAARKAVDLKEAKDTVEIAVEGKPLATYHFGNPQIGAVQTRRPYFYPVFGPDQTPMMRTYPVDANVPEGASKDHPHHTSIWSAYGAVSGVENWMNGDKAGWQLHKSFEAVTSGPVFGGFRETLDWTTPEKKPNMAEVRTVRIYRTPPAIRIMDLEFAFQARYGPVEFGDTKEGGTISTRMRDELRADKNGKQGRLVNAQGLSAEAAWGKRSEWVDASGLVGEKRIGYAVFDNPANLRHPTWWHARTYGLLCANPFGQSSFEKGAPKGNYTLEAGKELVLRYRIYFHAGDEKESAVAARYADYADPPRATWK